MGFNSSPQMKDVLEKAREEAHRNSQLVEPSHLLWAMIHAPDSDAYTIMMAKVPLGSIKSQVARLVCSESTCTEQVAQPIPLSPSAKSAMENSISRVMDRDMRWRTSDLLLGILRDTESPSALLLAAHDLTAEIVESMTTDAQDS